MREWKLLLAPATCRVSPHIMFMAVYKEWKDYFYANLLCECRFLLALLSGESFLKLCYCFAPPSHSARNWLAATENVPPETASQRRVSGKEFVQPGKTALWGFALKIPADASLCRSDNLCTYGRLLDWADEKSDRPRIASVDPMARIARTVNHTALIWLYLICHARCGTQPPR